VTRAAATLALVAAVMACGGGGHLEPIPVGDACDRAQARLVELGCDWRVNSKGGTWASSCAYLAGKGYPRIVEVAECVSAAPSCTEARACH
jgi:hypothetical protein